MPCPNLLRRTWSMALSAFAALTLTVSPADAGSLTVLVQGDDGRPLRDAVVYLESPAAKAATRPQPQAEIVQAGRQFVPRVTVVSVGTAVAFPNRDTVRHHVYSFSPAKTFELKLYSGTPARPVLFDRPGVAVLGCNIHDQMAAWVLVLETPFHARTGADGVARFEQVPEGAYRLRTWHDSLPPESAPLDQPLSLANVDARVAVRLGGPAR